MDVNIDEVPRGNTCPRVTWASTDSADKRVNKNSREKRTFPAADYADYLVQLC